MKKSWVIGLVVLGLMVISACNASALFIGLTDGYVRNMMGGYVSGASVTVTVSGCSGGGANGCTNTVTSDINGYYIANNLNLPKLGGVSVVATKLTGSGSASGTADGTQVAHVNITVCYAPTSPSLTDVPDGDDPDVTFSWSSGTDPNALSTTDSFRLDLGTPATVTSPHSLTGLSFSSHSWDVRTCNSGCCSPWVSDSFILTCPAPTAPTLTPVANSHSTSATFAWTSGVDPHGRTIHDEFTLDSSTTNPAVSPIPRTGLSFSTHNWDVKTCNNLCCGTSSSSFTVGNSAPSAPTNVNATPDSLTGLTALSWTEGVDPESDAIYNELRYQNGTLISGSATSPTNVPTELLIKWRVRTCDSFSACSAWVDVDSVTCSGVTQTCPVCSSGGGGGRKTNNTCTAPENLPLEFKKTELRCNGVAFSSDAILRIDMDYNKNHKRLNIYGLNFSLEDLDYCPWCYNGVKDFDEKGVDCDGSCRPCTEIERPTEIKDNGARAAFIAAIILMILAGIIAHLKNRGVLRRIFLRKYYYGI